MERLSLKSLEAAVKARRIAEADVPISDELRTQVIHEFVSKIRVVRWIDVKR